jgi:peptidyl-prolyl cis-trans isomerase A (cyclophilin A)
MFRKLASCVLIVGLVAVCCGFIAGCEEGQTKETVTSAVEPVVEVVTPVVEPVVEVVENIVEPVVEVVTPVVEPVVEVVENAVEAVVEVVAEPAVPTVTLDTSMGKIVIELDPEMAPITVKNFLGYVKNGFYDGLIFHRVIPGFMIQGGGFNPEMVEKANGKSIKNESNNGLGNSRGTIAMARGPQANSATCQFFINVRSNASLNFGGPNGVGYAVFGKVIEGMKVVDAIVSVPRTTKISNRGAALENNPVTAIVIKSAKSN